MDISNVIGLAALGLAFYGLWRQTGREAQSDSESRASKDIRIAILESQLDAANKQIEALQKDVFYWQHESPRAVREPTTDIQITNAPVAREGGMDMRDNAQVQAKNDVVGGDVKTQGEK